jgi:serine/threonine protein phosphatase 1
MIYCISDIHGEYDLFLSLLDEIKFCGQDKLIVLGDIIDKGADSVKLLNLIRSLNNAECIMGNHEYAFLQYYRSLMKDSPQDFDAVLDKLQKYFTGDGKLLSWEAVDWLESLAYYTEYPDFICVHSGVRLDGQGNIMPLDKTPMEYFLYDRKFKEPGVLPGGGKCVLFGHTPTKYLTGKSEIIKYAKPTIIIRKNKRLLQNTSRYRRLSYRRARLRLHRNDAVLLRGAAAIVM